MVKQGGWKKSLARRQLDSRLGGLKELGAAGAPTEGWIRAVRFALGMSGRQLAQRLGVTRQNVSRIENGEPGGSVSLGMIRRVAEALDCSLFYCLVPNTSLEETVRKRAEKAAWTAIERANRSMRLEGQGISADEARDAWKKEVDRLIAEMPRSLWDVEA